MTQNSDQPPATAFSRALNIVAPGASSSQLAPLFENKVNRTTIAHWRNGRRSVPLWAIERIRQIHASESAELAGYLTEAAQKETGPGRRAGAINIKRWNASNPR